MEGEESAPVETDVEDSNPNAAGPQGLRGGMGVSSERTGPGDGSTDGTIDTTGSDGPDDVPSEGSADESNTAEVPAHPFDASRNPGHSHG